MRDAAVAAGGQVEHLVLERDLRPAALVAHLLSGNETLRVLRSAGVPMYGVSGIFVDPADNRAHGLNERVEVKRLYEGREFLYRLVRRLAE
jgi:acetylornithine deacetylase/succinyl-diaminopimelate desuccinylase-like protein